MQSRRRLCVSALLAHGPWYTLGDASALPCTTACRPRPRQSVPSDAIPLAKGQNRRMRSRLFRWLQRLLCTHAQILEERSGKLLSIIVPLKAKVRPLWLHGNHGHRIATTAVRHGSHTSHSLGCRRCQGTIGYYGRSHLHAHSHPHPGTLWQTLTRARPREASYRSPSQVNALHADTYPLADRPVTAGAPKAKKAKAANVEKSAAKGAIVLHPALLAMEIEQFKREVAPPIGIVGGCVRARPPPRLSGSCLHGRRSVHQWRPAVRCSSAHELAWMRCRSWQRCFMRRSRRLETSTCSG
jgi:hypothetical protein